MIRFAILYFMMLIVFVALLIGPVVARRFVAIPDGIPMDLLQPTGQNNNDTLGRTQTGTAVLGGAATATDDSSGNGGGAASTGDGGADSGAAPTTTSPFDRVRLM